MTKKQIKDLWQEFKDHNLDVPKYEMEEFLDVCDADDFVCILDGSEFRFINEKAIWDIYVEEIQQVTEECYLGGMDTDKLWWIAIDWKKTAENCLDADGYGHHFATYDGEEMELMIGKNLYYFFRTN